MTQRDVINTPMMDDPTDCYSKGVWW